MSRWHPRRASAAGKSGRLAEDVPGSSDLENRQSECDDRTHDHSEPEQPPTSTPTSLRKERMDIRSELFGRQFIHNRRLGLEQSNGHRTTMTSTMFPVKVDRSDPLALHDQVAAEIRRAIADGEAGPGERLPLAKDMAAILGVNKNTVLRALHILRDEGLLDFQRGRGITVAGTPERSVVINRVRELVEFCRIQGYRRDEIVEMIEALP